MPSSRKSRHGLIAVIVLGLVALSLLCVVPVSAQTGGDATEIDDNDFNCSEYSPWGECRWVTVEVCYAYADGTESCHEEGEFYTSTGIPPGALIPCGIEPGKSENGCIELTVRYIPTVLGGNGSFLVGVSLPAYSSGYSFRYTTISSGIGFDDSCTESSESESVLAGRLARLDSFDFYVCDSNGGTITAELMRGNEVVSTDTVFVNVLGEDGWTTSFEEYEETPYDFFLE